MVIAAEQAYKEYSIYPFTESASMNRNTLYLLIGLLVVGLVVVGYLYYQESQSGVQIRIGDQGISIDGN